MSYKKICSIRKMPSVHSDVVENPDDPLETADDQPTADGEPNAVDTGKKFTKASGGFLVTLFDVFSNAMEAATCILQGKSDCDYYSFGIVITIIAIIFYSIYSFLSVRQQFSSPMYPMPPPMYGYR